MNKHTPGPLEACSECGNTWLILKADNGRVDSATCEACRYHWHVGVNVAAAQELLEAAKAARMLGTAGETLGRIALDALLDRVIAKAEGRS